MHLRIVRTIYKGKTREYLQAVESVRVGTQINKRVLASLGRIDDPDSPASYILQGKMFEGKEAKLYALPTAIYTIVNNTLQLPSLFAEFFGKKGTDVITVTLLMIIHRIIDPDSKLSLTRWYKNILLPITLPKTLKVHTLYHILDLLFEKKEQIEQYLFTLLKQQGYIEASIVFYDITSSYFEGDKCPLGKKAYSRDHRPDRPQIILGLVIDKKNKLPVYSEVHMGNMSEPETVKQIIEKLKSKFSITEVIFVADKGMLTPENITELQNNNYQYILSQCMDEAFTQETRKTLFEQKETMLRLPEEQESKEQETDTLWYTEMPDKNNGKIIVCYNPKTYALANHTRSEKIKRLKAFITDTKKKNKEEIELTKDPEEKLMKIQKVRDTILARLVKSRGRKYFDLKIDNHEDIQFDGLFTLKQNVADREEHMDGFFLVKPKANLSTEELIKSYKDLKMIEDSFRTLKTFIELRPIYHWTEKRVKAHVFLCVLSFLVGRVLEIKTGKTIKMLREEHAASVAIPSDREGYQPLILGGKDLLTAVQ